jgi:hypothetical protein
MRVENIQGKNGRAVPNQFVIHDDTATYFQSYKTIIVKQTVEDNQIVTYLDKTYHDYSRTTVKYRNQFLGETSKQVKFKIDHGAYKLVDLNENNKEGLV